MFVEGGFFTGGRQEWPGPEYGQDGVQGGESPGVPDFEGDDGRVGQPRHGGQRALGELLAFPENGDLLTDGIPGGEIATSKRPPERIEGLRPSGEVSEATFELSDGGKRDARGGRHRGLGETGPFPEFPKLHPQSVLEQFLYQMTVGYLQKRKRIFTSSARKTSDSVK